MAGNKRNQQQQMSANTKNKNQKTQQQQQRQKPKPKQTNNQQQSIKQSNQLSSRDLVLLADAKKRQQQSQRDKAKATTSQRRAIVSSAQQNSLVPTALRDLRNPMSSGRYNVAFAMAGGPRRMRVPRPFFTGLTSHSRYAVTTATMGRYTTTVPAGELRTYFFNPYNHTAPLVVLNNAQSTTTVGMDRHDLRLDHDATAWTQTNVWNGSSPWTHFSHGNPTSVNIAQFLPFGQTLATRIKLEVNPNWETTGKVYGFSPLGNRRFSQGPKVRAMRTFTSDGESMHDINLTPLLHAHTWQGEDTDVTPAAFAATYGETHLLNGSSTRNNHFCVTGAINEGWARPGELPHAGSVASNGFSVNIQNGLRPRNVQCLYQFGYFVIANDHATAAMTVSLSADVVMAIVVAPDDEGAADSNLTPSITSAIYDRLPLLSFHVLGAAYEGCSMGLLATPNGTPKEIFDSASASIGKQLGAVMATEHALERPSSLQIIGSDLKDIAHEPIQMGKDLITGHPIKAAGDFFGEIANAGRFVKDTAVPIFHTIEDIFRG